MRPVLTALLTLPLLAGCPTETPDELNAAGFASFADRDVPSGGAGPCAADLAHIDNDGILDLAVSHLFSNTATLLFGDGEGDFEGSWVTFPHLIPLRLNGEGGVIDIADLDNDEAPDVLVTSGDSDELFLFRNPQGQLGDRPFEPEVLDVGEFPFGVVAADFDGTPGLDIAVSHGESNDIWVFRGPDGASFLPPETYLTDGIEPGFVRAADVDGDDRLDLIATNHSSGEVSVLLSEGGGFTSATTFPVGEGPSSPATVDVNGDGNIDVITANELSETLSILFGDGSGAFTDGGTLNPNGIPFYVQPVDFDGDGDLDIAVPLEDRAVVVFWENDGDGGFSNIAETGVGSAPASMAAGDIDGDGDDDLIVTNFFGDSISVLLSRRLD